VLKMFDARFERLRDAGEVELPCRLAGLF